MTLYDRKTYGHGRIPKAKLAEDGTYDPTKTPVYLNTNIKNNSNHPIETTHDLPRNANGFLASDINYSLPLDTNRYNENLEVINAYPNPINGLSIKTDLTKLKNKTGNITNTDLPILSTAKVIPIFAGKSLLDTKENIYPLYDYMVDNTIENLIANEDYHPGLQQFENNTITTYFFRNLSPVYVQNRGNQSTNNIHDNNTIYSTGTETVSNAVVQLEMVGNALQISVPTIEMKTVGAGLNIISSYPTKVSNDSKYSHSWGEVWSVFPIGSEIPVTFDNEDKDINYEYAQDEIILKTWKPSVEVGNGANIISYSEPVLNDVNKPFGSTTTPVTVKGIKSASPCLKIVETDDSITVEYVKSVGCIAQGSCNDTYNIDSRYLAETGSNTITFRTKDDDRPSGIVTQEIETNINKTYTEYEAGILTGITSYTYDNKHNTTAYSLECIDGFYNLTLKHTQSVINFETESISSVTKQLATYVLDHFKDPATYNPKQKVEIVLNDILLHDELTSKVSANLNGTYIYNEEATVAQLQTNTDFERMSVWL